MPRKSELGYCNDQAKMLNKEETVASLKEHSEVLEIFDQKAKGLVPSTDVELNNSFYENSDAAVNLVYQVVYPDDLNLKPNSSSKKLLQGRRKKPKIQVESPPSPQKTKIKVVAKTRSGREVKFPKYIENEFKKIEINDDLKLDSGDVKICDFVKYTDADEKSKPEPPKKLLDESGIVYRKRRIPAQYRCPKCKKAYLGRSKILEHLKKNPSHGPMHQNDEEKNFEVWNYLVNVTQKCPSSERGQKFCQELSNLLHNLLLLTNALFKKLGSAANEVKIDKVLGNAIGLAPGSYYFDDNNLYKNVTVLKLMANNDFLHSIKSKIEENNIKFNTSCSCGKKGGIDELFLRSMLITPETGSTISKEEVHSKKVLTQNVLVDPIGENTSKNGQVIINKFTGDEFNSAAEDSSKSCSRVNIEKFTGDEFFASSEVKSNFSSISNYHIKNSIENKSDPTNIVTSNENCTEQNSLSEVNNVLHFNGTDSTQPHHFCKKTGIELDNKDKHKTFSQDEFFSSSVNLESNFAVNHDYEMKPPYDGQTDLSISNISSEGQKEKSPSSSKIKIQSNILICPPKFFQKSTATDSKPLAPVSPELMTDNSVLTPLPNLRHSVDELMLAVSSEHNNILDNSSSSDEVMNVDQFVNERFRKITESDMEVTNGNSLNLELPSLDLFQFSTT